MVVIVGSGPSLRGQGRGPEIDAYPIVVRVINLWESDCEDHVPPTISDHGSKTDYLVSSTYLGPRVYESIYRPNNETWVFGRPGEVDERTVKKEFARFNPVICYEAGHWLKEYINLGARSFAKGFRPIPQSGAVATILAMARIRPMKIALAGFDDFLNPVKDHRQKHDLVAERKLVTMAAKYYKTQIEAF